MMKKQGFTLAEVLITLTIIGVIATMTLPALLANTQEQQAKTALKKAINTLSEAAQMTLAVDGIDYSTLAGYGDIEADSTAADNEGTLAYILHNRTQVDYGKVGTELKSQGGEKFTQVVPLRDGTAILLPDSKTSFGDNDKKLNTLDNLPVGFVVVYDTNGFKRPNVLSNCTGVTAGASEEIEATDGTDFSVKAESEEDKGDAGANNYEACGKKGQRVIADQFLLRLRGTYVQPEGAAATWAFNN